MWLLQQAKPMVPPKPENSLNPSPFPCNSMRQSVTHRRNELALGCMIVLRLLLVTAALNYRYASPVNLIATTACILTRPQQIDTASRLIHPWHQARPL